MIIHDCLMIIQCIIIKTNNIIIIRTSVSTFTHIAVRLFVEQGLPIRHLVGWYWYWYWLVVFESNHLFKRKQCLDTADLGRDVHFRDDNDIVVLSRRPGPGCDQSQRKGERWQNLGRGCFLYNPWLSSWSWLGDDQKNYELSQLVKIVFKDNNNNDIWSHVQWRPVE